MSTIRSISFFLVISLSVSACVTLPEVAYDRPTSGVQKIGLLAPGFPSKATTPDMGGGGAAAMAAAGGFVGALIGGAIAASIQSNRDGKLEEIVLNKDFNARALFQDQLINALQSEGYEVIRLPSGESNRTAHAAELPEDTQGVDAVFDVVTTSYGFLSSGGEWRPHMHSKVLLTRVSDNSIVMQNIVNYNDFMVAGTQISISPNANYSWQKFDGVLETPDLAIAAMEDSINQSVAAIITLLK